MNNFRGVRPGHVVVASTLLVATAAALFVPALSQTTPQQRQPPQRQLKLIKAGDACDRKTDKARGVVKVDACGRWYCGRADVNDIIEVRPKFAEEAGCTWRLEGQRCKCLREPVQRKGG